MPPKHLIVIQVLQLKRIPDSSQKAESGSWADGTVFNVLSVNFDSQSRCTRVKRKLRLTITHSSVRVEPKLSGYHVNWTNVI
jgi:hypothetical protein